MKLLWTRTASADLDALVHYIAQDSITSALDVQDRIVTASVRLADFPFSGRAGSAEGTRELPVTGTPYLIVYTVDEQLVIVARVIHGRQQWPPQT